MTNKINVSMTVNGQERSMSVEPRMLLVDFPARRSWLNWYKYWL